MKAVYLIACCSAKLSTRAKARDLYISTLFRLSLAHAQSRRPDLILVLSAKHGVVALDDEIDPYDMTLNALPANDRRAWAAETLRQLAGRADLREDRFVILAGSRYREYLVPRLAKVEVPLQGMGIGKQLQFLSRFARTE